MSFLVIETDEERDALEVALGRAHATTLQKPWPMVPDIVGPGRYPCGLVEATPFAEIAPEQRVKVPRQRFYKRAKQIPETPGGVLEVDATVRALKVVDERAAVPKDRLPQKWIDVVDGKTPRAPGDEIMKGERDGLQRG